MNMIVQIYSYFISYYFEYIGITFNLKSAMSLNLNYCLNKIILFYMQITDLGSV